MTVKELYFSIVAYGFELNKNTFKIFRTFNFIEDQYDIFVNNLPDVRTDKMLPCYFYFTLC